ncbi:MarR family transcriptional regulator [Sporolactobacillus shoreicorticis]|uniref:MarR family winged helix-turn-helix transcriptional regulator n=1 Tax=Sporolactobacillus shoreicorticis TaxID=1923877 RepID=A0ABW5S334_9BACL|nr:MarR family transcriptional regulator [Sporolactobacillus shoreicorticis]MCO7125853.1 MarR family transcriptional regulator [Sporolactobacillus shoreicorticis]
MQLKKIDLMPDQQFLFGFIFVAANRIDTLLQRELKRFDVTTKQWFLSIVIDNLFDDPPTMKAAAQEMGSSHQNVKQIALKLEEKGLLVLEKDPYDARVTRLKLTKRSIDFWGELRNKGFVFTQALFKGVSDEDLHVARRVMRQVIKNISEMDQEEQ